MRVTLAILALTAFACGPLPDAISLRPCSGIKVELLDHLAAPPAHVTSRVRLTDCSGEALGARIGPEGFILAEDDQVLSAFEAQRAIHPVDRGQSELTLLLLDLSGSVTRAGLRAEMAAGARRLVAALASSQSIAVAGFDGRPDLISFGSFSTEPELIERAIAAAESSPLVDDSTNLYGAMVGALELLDRVVGEKSDQQDTISHGSLVVFTDGTDRAHRVSLDEVLKKIDQSPHAKYAVGVGAEIDPELLAKIAPDGQAIAAEAADLSRAFGAVAEILHAKSQTDYLVSYCSPARAGSHVLTVRAEAEGKSGQTKIDFVADGFGAGCDPEAGPLH